jgi:hypothetical protein
MYAGRKMLGSCSSTPLKAGLVKYFFCAVYTIRFVTFRSGSTFK